MFASLLKKKKKNFITASANNINFETDSFYMKSHAFKPTSTAECPSASMEIDHSSFQILVWCSGLKHLGFHSSKMSISDPDGWAGLWTLYYIPWCNVFSNIKRSTQSKIVS